MLPKVLFLRVASITLLCLVLLPQRGFAKEVRYELSVTQGSVNLSGKKTVDFALLINGTTPAPTLEFTEGDDAVITVHNKLQEDVSIHWHGLLLPPEMDGVPYVNTPPIKGGQSHTFRWRIRQHGTYWYHSHTRLQEQKGLYGGIIIHPKERKLKYDKDLVVVVSDWSDENADQIMANLRKDGDYYLYKKNSVRSLWGAFRAGGLRTHFANELSRMGGMDLSDVGYDAFLMNGKKEAQLLTGEPGQIVRIRVINAAASSYFYLAMGGEPMTVVAADGIDIKPVRAREVLIGMAETYDILFEIPKGRNTELRATVQDVTGFASGWIGSGDKVPAPAKPMPDMYAAMDHGSHGGHASHESHAPAANGDHGDHGDHGGHAAPEDHGEHGGHGDHEEEAQQPLPVIDTLTVDGLMASKATNFSPDKRRHEVKLVLGGDMERYVWHINGKAIHQDRTIEIREGDVVRFTFENETMMHHPMHLHGHFFRVMTEAGDSSPLKHTVDVPPHASRTIEFLADEPGEWMLHCHNLYHMKTGMGRVVKYMSYRPKPEVARHQKHDPHAHDHVYTTGTLDLATNHVKGQFKALRTWDSLDLDLGLSDYKESDSFEARLVYRRWFSNYFNVLAGGRFYDSAGESPVRAVIGMSYVLPLLIESEIWLDHKGWYGLDLEKKLQWTSDFYSDLEASIGKGDKPNYGVSLMYGPSWSWAAGIVYHHDTAGALLRLRF